MVGVCLLAGAAWLAVNAPVLGLAAKGQINEISLVERGAATAAGWQALWETPLGGEATARLSGINLVAAIASAGLPFVICTIAALVCPRISHRARPLTSAPIMVLLLTLATSQPAKDSTWVFVLAVMAYAVTNPPSSPYVGGKHGLGRQLGSVAPANVPGPGPAKLAPVRSSGLTESELHTRQAPEGLG